MTDISDDAKRNREGWTKANADYTDEQARHNWAATDGAVDHAYDTEFSVDSARQWPCEEIWVARKRC